MTKYRLYFNNFLVIAFSFIVIIRLIYLQTVKKEEFLAIYNQKSTNIIEGYSAPRGRIKDRNGTILVDNQRTNIITYRILTNNPSPIESAKSLLAIMPYDATASIAELKKYYLLTGEADKYLTAEEEQLYQERKLTKAEIDDLKLERIQDADLAIYDATMQKCIHLYYQMHKGYATETKILQKDVSDSICAQVREASIPGITCELSFTRVILDDAIPTIYGHVGAIPEEDQDYYTSLGYDLDDLVGISYLEKQYDSYLKGTKNKYLVNPDNSLTLIEEGSIGQDLILTIDIDLVKAINQIIDDNLLKSQSLRKTDYFNTAFVIVSDPNTGAILSLNGRQLLSDGKNITFKDVVTNTINTSYTVGSVVKGASMTVGYLNNLITPGKLINDACVKLHNVPAKCSFKRFGLIDDIAALRISSNYYQFLLAIALTGQTYTYNMELNATEEHFNIYRYTFALFGLGTLTGIDLPKETTGIKGSIIADDLLLNLSIGQYDTYTPMALSQYINTIAKDGTRMQMHLLNAVQKGGETTYEWQPTVLNTISNNWFFSRIKEGFKEVLATGTGRSFISPSYRPAGKTGTSETYLNNTTTLITQTFAAFAPIENPKYSIVVITPNISYTTIDSDDIYTAPINRYISSSVSKILFENY